MVRAFSVLGLGSHRRGKGEVVVILDGQPVIALRVQGILGKGLMSLWLNVS